MSLSASVLSSLLVGVMLLLLLVGSLGVRSVLCGWPPETQASVAQPGRAFVGVARSAEKRRPSFVLSASKGHVRLARGSAATLQPDSCPFLASGEGTCTGILRVVLGAAKQRLRAAPVQRRRQHHTGKQYTATIASSPPPLPSPVPPLNVCKQVVEAWAEHEAWRALEATAHGDRAAAAVAESAAAKRYGFAVADVEVVSRPCYFYQNLHPPVICMPD